MEHLKKIPHVNVRRGDTVLVICGKDKGKRGKVLEVDPHANRCVVEGVNVVVKHKKARNAQQKSSREKRAGTIDISNVMVLCKCGKPTRVGHKMVGENKVRACVKCKEVLDKKYVRAKDKEKVKDADTEEKKEEKTEKKPLQRREVKHTADSKVKKPDAAATNKVAAPRKMGGG